MTSIFHFDAMTALDGMQMEGFTVSQFHAAIRACLREANMAGRMIMDTQALRAAVEAKLGARFA